MSPDEPFIFVVPQRSVSTATKRQADKLFDRLKESPKLGRGKLSQKQEEWRMLYDAAYKASQLRGYLSVPFGNRTGLPCRWTMRNVLAAAVDQGILVERKRSNRLSRRQFAWAKVVK